MLSENFKRIRAAKGLSREKLSDASGVNAVTIWKIENGHGNPSLRTIEKLAKSLGVDVSLFFEDGLNFTKEA